MDLLADYTRFHETKLYFPTSSIQQCNCRKRSIFQNCLCGYTLVVGATLVACYYVKHGLHMQIQE